MNQIKDTLFVIPARGSSKGLSGKNIVLLAGKPLICYTIDEARAITSDENICVSSDDTEIINLVENYGLKVPFVRPANLATDSSGTREVILHAIDFFNNILGLCYRKVCILQPTSPFRTHTHIRDAFTLWSDDLDMVVSVKRSSANPYFNLFEEDRSGYLVKSKTGDFIRRQDCPDVWQYNGAIYIIRIESLKSTNINHLKKVKKYVMDEKSSHDIDTMIDLEIASVLIKS